MCIHLPEYVYSNHLKGVYTFQGESTTRVVRIHNKRVGIVYTPSGKVYQQSRASVYTMCSKSGRTVYTHGPNCLYTNLPPKKPHFVHKNRQKGNEKCIHIVRFAYTHWEIPNLYTKIAKKGSVYTEKNMVYTRDDTISCKKRYTKAK